MRISLFLRSTAFAWAAIIVGSLLGGCSGTTSGGSNPTAPVIVTQPANQTVCAGSPAEFSVTASGSGLHYSWAAHNNGGWGSAWSTSHTKTRT